MTRAATSEDVFTLEPEMQIDAPLSTKEESFTDRLQRVAQSLSSRSLERGSDVDFGDALPGILRGFTFEHASHDRGMMVAVVVAPLAFIACVIVTMAYFGASDGVAVVDSEKMTPTEISRITSVNKSALAEPVLVAPPRSAVSALSVSTSVTDSTNTRAVKEWAIDVPRGAIIRDIDLDSGRLAIHLSTDNGEKIIIYNTTTGAISGNLIVGPSLSEPNENLLSLVDNDGLVAPSRKGQSN